MIKDIFKGKADNLHPKTYPTDTLPHLLTDKLPTHIAVVMDGNGRWAARQGKTRAFGHKNALQSAEETIQGCIELHIPYLTLYAFSTENWQRPQQEIDLLMELFADTIRNKLNELAKNDIRFLVIGDIERLPPDCQEIVKEALATTNQNKTLQLTIALSYSGRWDIVQATKKLVTDIINKKIYTKDINADLFKSYLSTHATPDPDLLIRTGGDMRISNFMLWQTAYTELYFSDIYWPQFRKANLYQAIASYQKRERRFGKVCHSL